MSLSQSQVELNAMLNDPQAELDDLRECNDDLQFKADCHDEMKQKLWEMLEQHPTHGDFDSLYLWEIFELFHDEMLADHSAEMLWAEENIDQLNDEIDDLKTLRFDEEC